MSKPLAGAGESNRAVDGAGNPEVEAGAADGRPAAGGAGTGGFGGDLDLDALAEERDFLLSSLRDLDAEHDAGDIDDVDYETLRDDYTVRTAQVLRAIGRAEQPVNRAGGRRAGGGTDRRPAQGTVAKRLRARARDFWPRSWIHGWGGRRRPWR